MKPGIKIPESELVLNPDGSVYHLNLHPEQVADRVIVVGDPNRVKLISRQFDKIEHKISHREFITHTGEYRGKRITVIATGIGPDNIDIVLNELDAAVNIDLKERIIRKKKKSLDIVRIGTSGALQPDIAVDSFIVSAYGLGIDGLMNFYKFNHTPEERKIERAFVAQTGWHPRLNKPYVVKGSAELVSRIGKGMQKGITVTAPGFYGPQGRTLRLLPAVKHLNEKLTAFSFANNWRITNFEMETSALYGLGKALGHRCCTVCAIIANRVAKQYSQNSKKTIEQLIETVLERI